MINKELQDKLAEYPDDAEITIFEVSDDYRNPGKYIILEKSCVYYRLANNTIEIGEY